MFRKVLPHAAIVLSNMYIVFYLIDRVNSAMSFIDNGITKALLVLLAVVSIANAVFLIRDERRRVARAAQRRAQPRPAPRPDSSASPLRPGAPARRSRFGAY